MTSKKTVEYAFPVPVLASLTDNTLTALTQITVDIPDKGTITRAAVVVSATDIITATGGPCRWPVSSFGCDA